MPEIRLVYQQIKEYIEQEAKSRNPGDFLMSEVQYGKLFNVSRPTVRKAVDELVNSGLVKRMPGKGIAVASPENSGGDGNLLILVPFVPDDGFFYNMVMGCVEAANELGFNYKIVNCPADERLNYVKSTNLSAFSAAIMAAYKNEYDYRVLDILAQKRLPWVLVDNMLDGYDSACVVTNDFNGGYISCKYLLDRGHNKILYITLKADNHTVREREKGFVKALSDNGVPVDLKSIIRLENDEEIQDIMACRDVDFTAVCAYSDIPAIMCYNVLSSKEVSIPQKVSLMGYGDFSYSQLLKVPLTTVAMPVYDMGYKAAEMAAGIARGTVKPQKVILDVKIVERESVAFI